MAAKLTWHDVLAEEKEKPYFIETLKQVANQRAAGVTVYPPQKDVFNAFRLTELGDVKVVILGQDPYHGPNQAHGLAFSVLPGVPIPPSLQNMYKELQQDIPGFEKPSHGYLASWAEQGVLLLNTVLTVEAGKAHSHARLGWETFTDRVIDAINAQREGVIFYCGVRMRRRKAASLIASAIMCCRHRILLPFRHTAAFLAASISQKLTPC